MNYKIVGNTTGKVLRAEGVIMILPAIVSLIYAEWLSAIALSSVATVTFLIGATLAHFIKPDNQYLFAKEGLITVSLAWISISVFGALPFTISGQIPNYIDALFETVSGFTTTGASILLDVESLSHGMLFWRSFTHWIGGMGILVFVMAIASKNPDRSLHILRAEMPGPTVDKFVPKAKDTTLILYVIYTTLTLLLIIMLLCGGNSLFDSVIHAFGTAGTGGFGMKADGLASYSNYTQWVIAIFMLLFGCNFNIFYLIIIGKFTSAIKSTELLTYLGIYATSVLLIAFNIYQLYGNFWEVLRHSVFQTSSIMTTTGFSTTDFTNWPALSQTLLLVLMFIGGCAGSTAGGFKVSRIVIIFKSISNNLKKVLHPRTTTTIKLDGKKLEEDTIKGVSAYLDIYIIIFFIIFLLLALDPFNTAIAGENAILTHFSSTAACINNIGPGLSIVGPMSSYAVYSPLSKIILIFAMLLGRLEIYPILLTINIFTWIKK